MNINDINNLIVRFMFAESILQKNKRRLSKIAKRPRTNVG